MCLTPIIIKNQSKSYKSGIHPLYHQVPCGHCAECRRLKIQEWSLRAFAEVNITLSKGGFSLFPTLTYDNDHLPIFHSDRDNGYDIPCFDKSHIDKFLNSLRKYYERKGITGIKYLICSEYGENTQRPHYHCLIHFPSGCDQSEAVKMIDKYWNYGLVGYSTLGKEVINYEGCLYVSKYIVKDLYYLGRRDLCAFLDSKKSDYSDRYEEIKSYLPRHWQSKGFGECLVDEIKKSNNPFDKLFNGYRIPLTDQTLPYPTYIKNKLCYEYLKDGRRVLSEFGKKYKIDNFDNQLFKNVDNITKQLSIDSLLGKFDDQIVSELDIFPNCKTVSDLKQFLDYFMEENEFSITDYATYLMCFRGRTYKLNSGIDIIDIEDMYERGKSLYYQSVDYDYSQLPEREYSEIVRSQSFDEKRLYNYKPEFRYLEEFYYYVSYIMGVNKERKESYKEQQDKVIKKLKDMFNKNKFGF